MVKDVIVLGTDTPCGSYVLRMWVEADLGLAIGRYRQGALITVPRGELVYAGSAMGHKGSTTLARRLLRHATRRPPKRPHGIRSRLIETLIEYGMAGEGIRAPSDKKLFWNVDYFLDQMTVHLRQIFILRSKERLEDAVAGTLLTDDACSAIAHGLGAHDRPGATHLLNVYAHEAWWDDLPARLSALLPPVSPGRK